MTTQAFNLQSPTAPAQHHCFHCSNDWWPRTFTRPQRCPRCQCKFWNVPHYPGLHPRRQGNLRLPTIHAEAPPPDQPPTPTTADPAPTPEPEKGNPHATE